MGSSPQAVVEPAAWAEGALIAFPSSTAARHEYEAVLRLHAEHYARWMAQEAAQLEGLQGTPDGQSAAIQRLRVDERNMLRALDYALELHERGLLTSIAQHLRLPLELRGEFRLIGEIYAALLTEAQCLKDEALELLARLGLSRVALAHSQPEQAMREAEAAEGLADALDDRLGLLRSRFLQAEVQWMRCEKGQAEAGYVQALELAREIGTAAETCQCLCELAACAHDAQDFPRCEAVLTEARDLAEQHGLDSHLGAALRIEGNILFEQGRLEEAHAAYQRAMELSHELDNEVGVGIALRGLAGVAFFQKDIAKARRLLEQSLDILRNRGDRYGYAMTLNNLASVLAEQGDHVRAAQLGRETVAITVELGDRHGEAIAHANLALNYLKLDQVAPALESLRAALDGYSAAGSRSGQLICASWTAVVLARLGRYGPAATLLAAVRGRLDSIAGSHRSSCEGGLVQADRLIAAAVDSGELSREELEQQFAVGEALDEAETARYAQRVVR